MSGNDVSQNFDEPEESEEWEASKGGPDEQAVEDPVESEAWEREKGGEEE